MQVLVSPPHCRRSYARIVSPRRLTPSLFPLKQSLGTFYLGIRDYTPCHKETGGGGYEWPRSVSDARDLPQTPQRNCSGQSATRRGIVSGMFSAAQACAHSRHVLSAGSSLSRKCALKGSCPGDSAASALPSPEFPSWGASASAGCPRHAALRAVSGAGALGGGSPLGAGTLGPE